MSAEVRPYVMEPTRETGTSEPRAWTGPERFAFRAAIAYFGVFFLGSLLDSAPGPRRLLAAASSPVGWFGHTAMRLGGSPNDGGAQWAIAQQIVAVLVALAIAAVWSLASRRREYRRPYGWFRIALRYYVAIIMLVYGGFKVIESQFPPLTIDQLVQPLGNLAPMGLLWSFMGYSAVYASFTGLGETIGALLLFFRRTTTAGALILVAVLSNVALLNYTFDVPVKQLSSNLLLAAMVLALPDLRRLLDVFVLNRPTEPVDLTFDIPRWLCRVRRFLKPVVIVVATSGPLVFSFFVHRRMHERPALFGFYEVAEFVRDGTPVAPILAEPERWRSVVFGRPGAVSIRFMSDRIRVLDATVDTVAHRLTLSPRDNSRISGVLAYEQLPDSGLRILGKLVAYSVDVTLRRIDERTVFRLLR